MLTPPRFTPLLVALAMTVALPVCSAGTKTLWMTAFTDVTSEGQTFASVTKDASLPYLLISGELHKTNWPSSDMKVSREDLDPALSEAMGSRGYVPLTASGTPGVVVAYHWGSHNLPTMNSDQLGSDQVAMNILERAALAGGRTFAIELKVAMRDSATSALTNGQGLNGTGGRAAISVAGMASMADPLKRFRDRSDHHAFLIDQSCEDVYFVVVSAFLYDESAQTRGPLAWRTSGTVRSEKLSARKTLPLLLAAISPYLGQPTPEAATIKQKITD